MSEHVSFAGIGGKQCVKIILQLSTVDLDHTAVEIIPTTKGRVSKLGINLKFVFSGVGIISNYRPPAVIVGQQISFNANKIFCLGKIGSNYF